MEAGLVGGGVRRGGVGRRRWAVLEAFWGEGRLRARLKASRLVEESCEGGRSDIDGFGLRSCVDFRS